MTIMSKAPQIVSLNLYQAESSSAFEYPVVKRAIKQPREDRDDIEAPNLINLVQRFIAHKKCSLCQRTACTNEGCVDAATNQEVHQNLADEVAQLNHTLKYIPA
jgi:hypothetical protein